MNNKSLYREASKIKYGTRKVHKSPHKLFCRLPDVLKNNCKAKDPSKFKQTTLSCLMKYAQIGNLLRTKRKDFRLELPDSLLSFYWILKFSDSI